MTVENASYPEGLDASLPLGSDFKSEGDNHLRLIKQVIKNALETTQGIATQVNAENIASPSAIKIMTALRTYQQVTARIATQAIAEGGTDNDRLMTSLRTENYVDARQSDQITAETGTDNVKLMTSLRVVQQVTARIASQAAAEARVDNFALLTPLRGAQCAQSLITNLYANQSTAEAGASSATIMSPLGSRQHGDARYLQIAQTTAFTRSLLDDASASAARGTLGLSSAATASISSSVTSTSTTVLANSAAAKTAYDRGTTALNTANSKYPDTADNWQGIGSFTLAMENLSSGSSLASGGTISGSNLRAVTLRDDGIGNLTLSTTATSYPGTWRNMGGSVSLVGGPTVSLWVRVS